MTKKKTKTKFSWKKHNEWLDTFRGITVYPENNTTKEKENETNKKK